MTDFAGLLDGYRRFRAGDWQTQRARWADLAEGQSPRVMVIGCSDSRVDPTRIFDAPPGEMFVVRNVANLVPPFETGGGRHGVSAALEYAVCVLKVAEVVVIGHGACGGIAASLDGSLAGAKPGEGGFVADWIDLLEPARAEIVAEHGTGEAAARLLERRAVEVSLENLRTFPFVREAEAEGRLTLYGAYFAIRDGLLHVRDPVSGVFAPARH